MFWERSSDLNAHLCGTVIRKLDGTPVYIISTELDEGSASLEYLILGGDNSPERLPLDQFNLESCPLGYVNIQGVTRFISRVPRRRWKWGIDPSSLRTSTGSFNFDSFGDRARALRDCINNKYPSFQRATRNNTAFSRNLRVYEGNVMFQDEVIGAVEAEGITLLPKYSFMSNHPEVMPYVNN